MKRLLICVLFVAMSPLVVNAGQTFGEWASSNWKYPNGVPLSSTIIYAEVHPYEGYETEITSLEGLNKFTNLRRLWCTNHDVRVIRSNDLAGINNLEDLRISNIRGAWLREIEPGAFDGLNNLDQMYLGNRSITTLPSDLFVLPNLRTLYLSIHRDLIEVNLQGMNLPMLSSFMITDDRLNTLRIVKLNNASLSQLSFNALLNNGNRYYYGIAEITTLEEIDFSFANLSAVNDLSELGESESVESLNFNGTVFHSDFTTNNYQELVDLITILDTKSLDNLTLDESAYYGNQIAFDSWDAVEDNILTVAPEPSAFLLLTTGLFGIGLVRRKRN